MFGRIVIILFSVVLILSTAPDITAQRTDTPQSPRQPAGADRQDGQRDSGRQQQDQQGGAQATPQQQQQQQQQKYSATQIREIQQSLKDQGFDPGPVDGIMGERTRQALREFQRQNNLEVTGDIDEQ